MPKYKINDKEFELINPFKPGDIDNEDYEYALKLIEEFKKSDKYTGMESTDALFDIVLSNYKQETINSIAEGLTEEHFNSPRYNHENEIHDELVKMTREWAETYKADYKKFNDEVAKKWANQTPKQLSETIIKDLLGDLLLTDEPALKYIEDLSKLDIGKLKKEDISEKYPALVDKADKLAEYKEMAADVIDYRNKVGSLDVSAEEYSKSKLGNFKEEVFETSEKYLEMQASLQQEKNAYYNEQKARLTKAYNSPLKDTKDLYLNAKEQAIDMFKERESLVNKYNQTSLGSRIARWLLPNSWSKAGQIQNEIDKIDKAVKDAGYNKNDINVIKFEIEQEKIADKNNSVENPEETSSELSDSQDDINLHQGLKDKTVDPEIANKSQAVENKNIEREEVITQ